MKNLIKPLVLALALTPAAGNAAPGKTTIQEKIEAVRHCVENNATFCGIMDNTLRTADEYTPPNTCKKTAIQIVKTEEDVIGFCTKPPESSGTNCGEIRAYIGDLADKIQGCKATTPATQ